MKVKIYSINTTTGPLYGLINAESGDVLRCATARWKTRAGAARFAKRMGFELQK